MVLMERTVICQNIFTVIHVLIILSRCIKAHGIYESGATISCGHQPPDREQVIHDVQLEAAHTIIKRSADQPLRIHLHFDDSIHSLPSRQRGLVKNMVREAVLYWEDTLFVKRTDVPIRLNRQCSTTVRYKDGYKRYCVDGCSPITRCGDIFIPPQHLEACYFWNSFTKMWMVGNNAGPGVVDADFILFVAALSTGRCQKARTIAYAAHCQQEAALDRPVAGYFSICPESISVEKQDHLQLLSTIKHEMLHALGFTAGLYAFYRDSNGQPLTPRYGTNKPSYNSELKLYQWSDNTVRKVTRQRWKVRGGYYDKTVHLVVTPKVVEEVRKHFNCSTLEGAELEDQGIIGTNLTHWEKRIFENEAMTGTYTQNPVISRITLAMMEDTGWYKVKYENAEELEWGKNLGCDFVNKSCLDWMDERKKRNEDIHPFCDEVKRGLLKTDCTNNRDAVAFCNLVEYKQPLSEKYQYFRSLTAVPVSNIDRYGGSVALADFCPYLQEFAWRNGDITVRDSRCGLHENNPGDRNNLFGETYGEGSKCFNHESLWTLEQCNRPVGLPHGGSGCYRYQCRERLGLLIYVNGKAHHCLKAGQKLRVNFVSKYYLHTGHIICPSCQEMCQKSGITCPPEHEPTFQIVSEVSKLQVPCSNTKVIHHSTYHIAWTSILANILCIIGIYMCHR